LLQLVDQVLHVIVLLLVLVGLELEFFETALRFPEVLRRVAESSLFCVEFVLHFVDPGLQLGRGLLAVLQGVHLGLVKSNLKVKKVE
jgi:hypothetical protein